jgi:hypothetical protein
VASALEAKAFKHALVQNASKKRIARGTDNLRSRSMVKIGFMTARIKYRDIKNAVQN